MKYYLLGVSKCEKINKAINIGDYIQALASSQFLPKVDGFLDRDEDLKDYQGEDAKMIMNGWYMHNPKNWPPSKKIRPLFVAFHMNPLVEKELTTKESIDYLKGKQPIGCRDTHTLEILRSYGVNAYFSGCMTLTLGLNFAKKNNDGRVYFVDPKIKLSKVKSLASIKWLFYFIVHIRTCRLMMKKQYLMPNVGKKRILYIAKFVSDYSKLFPKNLLKEAEYITQESKFYYEDFQSEESRLDEARRLVTKYSNASLVVTSRIHCALPCLGMGTPVLFLRVDNDDYVSTSRFGGLGDLFNVIICKEKGLEPEFQHEGTITANHHPENKETWRPLAEKLIKVCRMFFNE